MKKMLLFASLFIIIMNSCQKEDNNDLVIDNPKDTAVAVKPITIDVKKVTIPNGVTFSSLGIVVVSSTALDKKGNPVTVDSGTLKEIPVSYKIENPKDFQGTVTVKFYCYVNNGVGTLDQKIVKTVDLTKESSFNDLVFTFN